MIALLQRVSLRTTFRSFATMRKGAWMFDSTGAEVRLEEGTMLRAANYKYDVELVERGEAPGTAELVFGRRTAKELRIANASFARGNVRYVDSFTNAEQVKKHDESLPELAFMGRSNCGKSSLLNAVCGEVIALVSNTPGRTRTINRFNVNNQFILMDVPGYGFAEISQQQRNIWLQMEHAFLGERKSLRTVFLLLDSRRGITEVDDYRIQAMEHAGVSYQLVLTKADKMKPQELRVVVADVEKAARSKKMNMAAPWVVTTSAQVGDYGIGDLRANICEAAGLSLDDTKPDMTEPPPPMPARTMTEMPF